VFKGGFGMVSIGRRKRMVSGVGLAMVFKQDGEGRWSFFSKFRAEVLAMVMVSIALFLLGNGLGKVLESIMVVPLPF